MRWEGRRSLPDESKTATGGTPAPPPENDEKVPIYFLPNLMTAGNLACGFFALTWIFQYKPEEGFEKIHVAIRLIQIHLCIIYLVSGLSKLLGKAWWEGTAVWGTLASFEFAPMQHGWYEGFELDPPVCAELRQESLQYYHRRIACMATQSVRLYCLSRRASYKASASRKEV